MSSWAVIAFQGYFLIAGSDYYMYGNMSMGSVLNNFKTVDIPSPEIVDAIHAQATCKVTTPTRDPSDVDSSRRQSIRAIVEVAKCKDKTLISGHFKDIVIKNGEIGLYGWFSGHGGKLIQPFYAGHSLNYTDYSQAYRRVWGEKFKTREEAEKRIKKGY